jgi:hypothetical protein
MKLKKISSPLKLLSQSQPNFADISSSLCLYSSNFGTFWLKIEQFWLFEEISIFSNGGHLEEISSNAQNCSIFSQKVLKFELYKHNDELFNIYYGIFHEL